MIFDRILPATTRRGDALAVTTDCFVTLVLIKVYEICIFPVLGNDLSGPHGEDEFIEVLR